MKKMVLAAIVSLALVFSAGSALAAGTATVDISANVLGTCAFNTGGTIAFGDLDPTSGLSPSVTNAAAANFTCTNGTDYSITDDGGLSGGYELDDNAGNVIPYALTYTGTGTGTGTASDLSITADIAFADYATKPAGTYSDTVTLTINP
ncbi:MAG: spore coat protein U domain-containing protein [Desulfuromonadales bacterium]